MQPKVPVFLHSIQKVTITTIQNSFIAVVKEGSENISQQKYFEINLASRWNKKTVRYLTNFTKFLKNYHLQKHKSSIRRRLSSWSTTLLALNTNKSTHKQIQHVIRLFNLGQEFYGLVYYSLRKKQIGLLKITNTTESQIAHSYLVSNHHLRFWLVLFKKFFLGDKFILKIRIKKKSTTKTWKIVLCKIICPNFYS